jgi:hypothetical protein
MIKLSMHRNIHSPDGMEISERRLQNDILEIERFRMTTKRFEILYSDIEKDVDQEVFEMNILFISCQCYYIVYTLNLV